MQTEIIISGFGGQGALFAGQLMAYSAMDNQLEVTWFPSYGPEMRGGTANCTVIISNEEIGAPVVGTPTAVIAMNLQSLDKYEEQVKTGGLLVVNASMVNRQATRADIHRVHVPASEIAERIGDRRLSNMVLLGSLLANLKVLDLKTVEASLKVHTPERHQRLVPLNIQALEEGATYLAE
ncbi:MAG: 2-oxoacid:ferredoxin oxidoreductase subunit gamma [Chloroflexi bacterium]|nr:2-oxoacid:ferredoxin oxidoreductase subunit gamma [Chloroflexota bacterium]